jgi:hypothetical protein
MDFEPDRHSSDPVKTNDNYNVTNTEQPVEKPESKDQFDLFHALRNDFRTIAAYNSMREVACENYS